MARNLTRNTKVYISTQGTLGSCTAVNTWEVKVLDGYNFSQATTKEDITVDEAGSSPIRGQKTYNVAVEPVDVTFSTYIRPYDNATPVVDAPERVLWSALAGSVHVLDGSGNNTDGTPDNGNAVVQGISDMAIDFEESDANELAELYIWFHLENTTYRIDEVSINSAEIDFSITDIAMISWTGMGTATTELVDADHTTIEGWAGGTEFRAVPVTNSASFLRNKLSTLVLQSTQVGTTLDTGTATGGTTTTIVETGATFIADGLISVGDYIRYSDDAFATWETKVVSALTGETTLTVEGTFDTAPTTGGWQAYAATDRAGQNYTIAITGGSLTIENNMSFLTPEELGTVNQPLPGFAGSRAIAGNITAYLNTGVYGTSALLADLNSDITSVTNKYALTLSIGGTSVAAKRVDLSLANAQLTIPTINVESVIATDIQFAGQGSSDLIENQDELVVTYYV